MDRKDGKGKDNFDMSDSRAGGRQTVQNYQHSGMDVKFVNYIQHLESLGIKSWEDFADTTDGMPLLFDTIDNMKQASI